jgi:hypothetical protein
MGMSLVDWNATDDPQEGVQQRFAIKFLINDVANRPGTGELQHDRVDPADVVRQEEKAAGWQIIGSERIDPVKAA